MKLSVICTLLCVQSTITASTPHINSRHRHHHHDDVIICRVWLFY